MDLQKLLKRISATRVAVIGDLCLDAYWFIDPARAETSIETGLETRPVKSQRYTLGGAGNVIRNLTALGVTQVDAFGVVGDDPYGREMLQLLQAGGVNTHGVITQADEWDTHVYTKPYVEQAEEQRIDFGNYNRLSDSNGRKLIELLESALADVDVVIVNEQVESGIHRSEDFRTGLAALIKGHSDTCFVLDSRHFSEHYEGTIHKMNDQEAARLCGIDRARDELVLHSEACAAAQALYQRWGQPVFVTRGARGCVVAGADGIEEVPGLQVLGRIDTVGAGDAFLAAIAAALAAGASCRDAAALGNFAAAVTVRKLFQTGTASPEEVLHIGLDPDYVYRPELAEDPRHARFHGDTEFEIVTHLPEKPRFTHAIFDHDGTISTLRQGWERIMEPVMVKAVLGPRYDDADESLYRSVVNHVRSFVDQTTGVQTISQMQGLVKMVREFACVPDDAILDAEGYKEIYTTELSQLVQQRIEKFKNDELALEDFTLKNAVALLRALHAKGVKLFLASGTDVDCVIAEAGELGYADVFCGRIYGAQAGEPQESKKLVLERIIADIGPENAQRIVTFGDGPVEIRETHKAGGYAIGVASNEVQRFGPNPEKRTRLIKAGADMIIPDYSQLDQLLAILGMT